MVARILSSFLVAVLFSPFMTLSARAQNGPLAPGSIAVTPDGSTTAIRQANTSGYGETFLVKNNYGTPITVTITCFGRINVTCTGTDITQITLAAGQQIDVLASYNVGTAGTGRLVVKAASGGVQDTGYFFIPVVNPAAPSIAFRNQNADNRDRSLCLTANAGEAAAWQCGDLLIAHGLPGYSTLGRERSLTLLYNSATAVARPAVAASVDETGLPSPGTVFTRLLFSSVARDSATYMGWGAANHQVVVPHDATNDTTGLYPFTLEITNQYSSGPLATTLSDSVIVVNRGASPFGSGWWLAGVEELHVLPGSKMLWIGGDGSAKVYRSVGTNTWQAAAGGYRDTLRYDPTTFTYTRTLRHGIRVVFDTTRHHIQTINRVGQVTTFTWSGSPLRLTSIQVPPGGTGTTYTLTYTTDASRQLDKITDPAGRVLDVTIASNRLTQIADPDSIATAFAYDAAGRLISRTNRRGFTTKYAYANGLRVTTDSIRTDTASAVYAVTAFDAWDNKGVAPSNGATGLQSVDVSLIYTKIDGPRPLPVGDTAEFWVDRWGAPTQSRDPLGNLTMLTRGNSTVPALVTRVAYPNGRIVGSNYDARANPQYVADSTYEGSGTTQTVTTSYVYGDSRFPDAPTLIRGPVDTVTATYDTIGLPSVYRAQGGHRTEFTFFANGVRKGLIASVTEDTVAVVDTTAWTKSTFNLTTSLNYDSLGNIVWMQSPKGLVTTYLRDTFTRVQRAWDPARHRTDYAFDKLNRVDTVTVYDDTLLNGTNRTLYHYTPTGLVDSTKDQRGVIRKWRFDAADRVIRETDDVGNNASTYYNAAGLPDSTRTRDGHTIVNTYDPAGRLTKTIYPANSVVPNSSVPGDTITRTYDVLGQLLTATDRNAIDSFFYYKEGSIRTSRQTIRDDDKTTAFDVTLRYWYDGGGRRTKFYNGIDTLRYTYGTDGLLAKLRVDWMAGGLAADSFLYTWDAVGRRDRLQYVNGTDISFGYDRDGNVRMACSKHPGGSLTDYLEQRLRYSKLDPDGQSIDYVRWRGSTDGSACSTVTGAQDEWFAGSSFDGRHQLLSRGGLKNESYQYDASGNITAKTVGVVQSTFVIGTSTNRLASGTVAGTNYLYVHDNNGSRIKDTVPLQILDLRKLYYNSIGRLVGDSFYWDDGTGFRWYGSLNVYRYDAQGRRVRVVGQPTFYMVYDGDNVVRVQSSINEWRYVQGPGLDDPLVAAYHPNTLWTARYYYITDGGGRQVAFTDSIGNDYQSDVLYTQNGGAQAGGITGSNGFDNQRAGTDGAPKLSYYRNRYYDQQTGRWTQEDPIGVGAGSNLYQFSGNNPVMFTDPFGLLDTAFTDDQARKETQACVKASEACAELVHKLAEDPGKYVISTGPLPDSQNPGDNRMSFSFGASGVVNGVTGATITIDPTHLGAASAYLGVPSTYGTNLVHELGHVVGTINIIQAGMVRSNSDPGCDQTCAIGAENAYRRQVGIDLRSLTRP